jgi:hypothetical protein
MFRIVMRKKSWEFNLDGKKHIVTFENKLTNDVLTVDGKIKEYPRDLPTLAGAEIDFKISGHKCFIKSKPKLTKFDYELIIDGKSVETGQETSKSLGVPNWVWIFIGACIIPAITASNLITGAVGFGGAFSCLWIARDPTRGRTIRISICAGVSVVCWLLFLYF